MSLSSSAAPQLGDGASLPQLVRELLQRVQEAAQQLEQLPATAPEAGQTAWEELNARGIGGYPVEQIAALAAGVAVLVALSVPPGEDDSGSSSGGGSSSRPAGPEGSRVGSTDSLPALWDPAAVGDYYQRRPAHVAQRAVQVLAAALQFGLQLLMDIAQGKVRANEARRARQLREAIEDLGPAYVKVAQAVSTRVDLLPAAYLIEVQKLQNEVPVFDTEIAYRMITKSFGKPVGEVFTSLSTRPVAAASLGQVYKATLTSTGQEVAIKCRRPGVLESVSLDLFIMRQVAERISGMPEVYSDWAAIIDEWATAFLNEMNYSREAQNTIMFRQQMLDAQLTGVVVPEVVAEGSNSEVLVTQWMQGEPLYSSSAADVRELCNTLLSAYLTQLLDTGMLHADPHPGNLLRTPDGKIAILDHGLVQSIPPDYSLSLLEYIAHLSTGDWDSVVFDLVKLGFLDDTGADMSALAEPLGIILKELSNGGGAARVDIPKVTSELERLTAVYPFRIPPIFALILRCFSVIEGTALRVDPSYSIVKECFPYLARRLLQDDSPRARQALRDLLFNGGDHVDIERVERMVQGFSDFTVAGLAEGVPADVDAPLLDDTAKEALKVVFNPQGSYVQELLVSEAVATVDAASRQLAAVVLGQLLGSAPALAGRSAIESLGPLRSVLLPLPTPLELLSRVYPFIEPNEEDERTLASASSLARLLQQLPTSQPGVQQGVLASRLARELVPLLPELLPGVGKTTALFAEQLAQRIAQRVSAQMSRSR